MGKRACNNHSESDLSDSTFSSIKSSASSCDDDSKVCHIEVCCQKCGVQNCEESCLRCVKPEVLACRLDGAIVQIQAEFILIGASGSAINNNTTPLAPNARADIIITGNGFFHDGVIVTSASTILLPPSLTSVAQRYPLASGNTLSFGVIKNEMVRASRIFVSVFNVNKHGVGYVYEADLVGVNGAFDIAVLSVSECRQANCGNPRIDFKCHPQIEFADSHKVKAGEKAYLLGDYISSAYNQRAANAVNAISDGLVSDAKYIDYAGWVLAPLVLISAPAYAFSTGLPILNCEGKAIGMQTTDLAAVLPHYESSVYTAQGAGFVAGPNTRFIKQSLREIKRGTSSQCRNCKIETICDSVGAFYRVKKAYLGLAYDVVTGIDYDIVTDYTSGPYPSGFPRVRLDSNGFFLNSPAVKVIEGIRVLGLAGLNPNDLNGVANGFYYVPGGTGVNAPLPDGLPVSPLINKLYPGDIIIGIKGQPLGDLECQGAPSSITSKLCVGDQVEVSWRSGGNAGSSSFTDCCGDYHLVRCQKFCLEDYPLALDYPWYAVNIFPLLSDPNAYAFNFGGQIRNPQVIGLEANRFTAPFHPSV